MIKKKEDILNKQILNQFKPDYPKRCTKVRVKMQITPSTKNLSIDSTKMTFSCFMTTGSIVAPIIIKQ